MLNKIFITPSGKSYTLQAIIDLAINMIKSGPDYEYRIYVGCDSQVKDHKRRVTQAQAIVIQRVGKGSFVAGAKDQCVNAIMHPIELMKQRIIQETANSIKLMEAIMDSELLFLVPADNFVIHIDVGYNGRSCEVMEYVTGWVRGLGYNYEIKPEAIAANCVADKYSK